MPGITDCFDLVLKTRDCVWVHRVPVGKVVVYVVDDFFSRSRLEAVFVFALGFAREERTRDALEVSVDVVDDVEV